ncbi:hypothetical protein ABFY09_06795 [Marinomonas sp. 5E14-1]|uniref:hypothetical protein n=1 Tax=Marinomonas sp. 5E14-1 TaxID=3153922 RepID=UPI003262E419
MKLATNVEGCRDILDLSFYVACHSSHELFGFISLFQLFKSDSPSACVRLIFAVEVLDTEDSKLISVLLLLLSLSMVI